ncbi:hypothetical protein MMYC01_203728 [Madurella mycetomatis]|uniref:Aminoglycoside phosphotransferase domain-containing protein n=1 Tax=Madurella mycetomatis TaxID=100816 RepID=A0A175W7D8_9PEZI|nr:hypothetical protein MMYC01_203728 [Madurella mycetomatis]
MDKMTYQETHKTQSLTNARSQCWCFAQSLYPSATLREAPTQGYCSYTLHLNDDTIIQFRPTRHQLDLDIASAARDTFGKLAPHVQLLDTIHVNDADDNRPNPLLVYSLSRIPGIPFSSLLSSFSAHNRPQPPSTPASVSASPSPSSYDREPLIRSFARLHATSYSSALTPTSPLLPALKRRVGQTLRWRLEQMHAHLPARFRPVVKRVLGALVDVESRLPWALTHGDLVPTNIMVDVDDDGDDAGQAGDKGGRGGIHLKGLIDWAEAEYLPFGVGLYGLEELLGTSSGAGSAGGGGDGSRYPPPGSIFTYFPDAARLRGVFWEELYGAIPELVTDAALRARVEDARLHGIAFDDGALDRVVRAGQDDEELQRLDLFVLGPAADGNIASPVPAASKIGERGHGKNPTLVSIKQDDKTTIKMRLDFPAVAGESCVG